MDTCRTITEDPTFISLEFQRERRKSRAERIFKKVMARNFLNFGQTEIYTSEKLGEPQTE